MILFFLRTVYRTIRDIYIDIVHLLIRLIPKERNLILFNSWFGQKYADNTRYLFEYLLNNPLERLGYHIVWTTSNEDVYLRLLKENIPVIKSNSLKGKWMQIRAELLLSTIQLHDYDSRLLSNCIYVDFDHGLPFKKAGYDIIGQDNSYIFKHERIVKKRIQYYSTTTSYACSCLLNQIYQVPLDHILLTGKPRTDLFFHDEYRANKLGISERIVQGKKVITYMPTHRKAGEVKIYITQVLDLDGIEHFCEENDCVFVFKKHYYHSKEIEDLSKYRNIYDLTNQAIDSQMLMFQTDILISDYSSSIPEYLVLNRPLILFPYDLDDYLKYDRDLQIPYDVIDFAPIASNSNELILQLQKAITDDDQYRIKRNDFTKLYYEEGLDTENACVSSWRCLKEILNHYHEGKEYTFDWSNYKSKLVNNQNVQKYIPYMNIQ